MRPAGKSGRCSRANWWKGFVNARFGAGAGGAAGGGVGGVGKAVCVEDELAEESPMFLHARQRARPVPGTVTRCCSIQLLTPDPTRGTSERRGEFSVRENTPRHNRDARSSPQSPRTLTGNMLSLLRNPPVTLLPQRVSTADLHELIVAICHAEGRRSVRDTGRGV